VTRALAQLQAGHEVTVDRQWFTLKAAVRAQTTTCPRESTREEPLPLLGRARLKHLRMLAKLISRFGFSEAGARMLTNGASLTAFETGERIPSAHGLETMMLVRGAACVMIDSDGAPLGVWVAKRGHFIGLGGARPGSDAPVFWAVALAPCVVATFKPELTSRVLAKAKPEEVLRFLIFCHVGLSRQLFNRCRMLTQDNVERLRGQLDILARDFPKPARDGVAVGLPLRPRRDLAALIGVSPTELSRALSRLQATKAVRVEPDGRLVVRAVPPGTTHPRRRTPPR
jgi:CRP-like cAMP-binding protein